MSEPTVEPAKCPHCGATAPSGVAVHERVTVSVQFDEEAVRKAFDRVMADYFEKARADIERSVRERFGTPRAYVKSEWQPHCKPPAIRPEER